MISLKKVLLCLTLCFQTIHSSHKNLIAPSDTNTAYNCDSDSDGFSVNSISKTTAQFDTKYCLSNSDSVRSDTQLSEVINTRQEAHNELSVITCCIKIFVATGLFLYLIPCDSGYSPFCTTCTIKKSENDKK